MPGDRYTEVTADWTDVPVYECSECPGSTIRDVDKHERWHALREAKRAAAEAPAPPEPEPAPVVEGLSDACGHHCGIDGVGGVHRVGHCPCPECHGRP